VLAVRSSFQQRHAPGSTPGAREVVIEVGKGTTQAPSWLKSHWCWPQARTTIPSGVCGFALHRIKAAVTHFLGLC